MNEYRVYVTVESLNKDGDEVDKYSDECVAHFYDKETALSFAVELERKADELNQWAAYTSAKR